MNIYNANPTTNQGWWRRPPHMQ